MACGVKDYWICCFHAFHFQFEADRRALIITLNSFGTELSKEDRETLFPTCGKLYPEGLHLLAQAEDFEQMKRVADNYGVSDFPSTLSALHYYFSMGPLEAHTSI